MKYLITDDIGEFLLRKKDIYKEENEVEPQVLVINPHYWDLLKNNRDAYRRYAGEDYNGEEYFFSLKVIKTNVDIIEFF